MSYTQNAQLAYAKLSATPTDSDWSQVYNAGNVFACIALTRTGPSEENTSLQALGKDILNHFESEFFTLEEKNLTTIKAAITKSVESLPKEVQVNLCLAFFKDTTLSLFLLGAGRIFLKRGEKVGVLLEQEEETKNLRTASGYINNGDILLLTTHHFTKHISDKHIREALQLSLPSDIAEELSVPMHATADGAQAAIVVSYHGVSSHTQTETEKETAQEESTETQEMPLDEETPPPPPHHQKQPLHFPKIRALSTLQLQLRHLHLTHTKKLFLSIIVIIAILLTVSIAFTKQQQENRQTAENFNQIYAPALKKYDEGIALKDLNKTVSDEDFRQAEELLLAGKDKFSPNSIEAKQIEELLKKIQKEQDQGAEDMTNIKEVSVDKTNILAVARDNPKAKAATQDDTAVYFVTDNEVISVAKKDGAKKTIIENDDDWKKAVGIAVYNGNIYLLDQDNNVLKFTAGSDGFGKSNYFPDAPELTKAVSIGIDSDVYILFSDGTMKKYLRGKEEGFSLKGLTPEFKDPTIVVTDGNTQSLYVLDPKNSRVVKLSKDGSFQKAYAASVIKQAKAIEVLEKENKLHILAQDKIWELGL